nr:ST.14 [Starmerella bombicola]
MAFEKLKNLRLWPIIPTNPQTLNDLKDDSTEELGREKRDAESEKNAEYLINVAGADSASETSENFAKFNQNDILAILPGSDDDDDLPASTWRMWVLAIVFGAVVAGTDAFFGMRFPSISISVVVILVVTWPLGQFLHLCMPAWQVKLPFGMGFNLNPGPFNYKEHACIFMFTNVVTSAGLVNNLVIEDTKFFEVNTGLGRQILFNISCYTISVALLGLFRDILVTPEDRVWPGVLSRIALFKAIYSRDNPVANGWKMTRWVFFLIIFLGSFTWYWFPDLILPFLSDIGAWISWIKPESATLSQVFGVKTGLGLFPLTFDWTQITSINNPLTTPMWAVASMFISFVFWIWIVMPGLYYQNQFETAHFPIMTNKVYTVDQKQYNFRNVVDSEFRLDMDKFRKYSPAMLPIAFLMNLALGIAVFAALVVHFALLFYDEVVVPWRLRNARKDRFNKALEKHKPWPLYLYAILFVIGLGLGFAFSEGWQPTPLDAGGFFVSVLIACCLYIPIALVEARANTLININSFFYIVAANWYKGQPVKLLYFYTFGFGIVQHAMHMAQSAKVGHYLSIRPKIYMTVLFFSGIWSALVSPSVTWFLLKHVKGICTDHAANNMTCRKQKTQFNTQGIWGLFGSHLFAPGGRYSWVLYFFLVGAVVALVHFILLKWRKTHKYAAAFDPILFFGGAENIPSVTGYNYSTWFVTAFLFNFVIHRKFTAWWRKYNLVTAIGMDVGVAITAIIVYFAIVYTGGTKHYNWWATEVASKGCDSKGCPHLNGPVPKPTGF